MTGVISIIFPGAEEPPFKEAIIPPASLLNFPSLSYFLLPANEKIG